MAEPKQPKIGILGGTFNPIHYGHLIAAECALVEYRLQGVIFVPSFNPPHKEEEVLNARHRYLMTILATSNHARFTVSDIEIKMGGKSYTKNTLEEFKKIYGDMIRLCLIIGTDVIPEIDTWKDIETLPSLCEFIVVSRPGYPFSFNEILKDAYKLKIPGVDISSSDIRERVKKGKSIKYLIPEEVRDYIYKYRLYR
ncbi:MAG: nicotinate-nucleotide adenylyltransferase [bacterium]|nr:nicotinate-nucleotide adenylyltransferase [bacterium]